jgi:hypothetical protein
LAKGECRVVAPIDCIENLLLHVHETNFTIMGTAVNLEVKIVNIKIKAINAEFYSY